MRRFNFRDKNNIFSMRRQLKSFAFAFDENCESNVTVCLTFSSYERDILNIEEGKVFCKYITNLLYSLCEIKILRLFYNNNISEMFMFNCANFSD